MDRGSNTLSSLRVSSHGVCNSKISWLLRGFLLTFMSVLSFHKLWSLPSILSRFSEVADCLQTNICDASLKSPSRGFSSSYLRQKMSVPALPSSSVVFLWSTLEPFPHGVSPGILTGVEKVIITPHFQVHPQNFCFQKH